MLLTCYPRRARPKSQNRFPYICGSRLCEDRGRDYDHARALVLACRAGFCSAFRDKQQAASSPLTGRLLNVLPRSGLVLSNDEREPEGERVSESDLSGGGKVTRYPVTPTGQLRRTHWDSNETHEQTQGEGDNC